MFNRNIGTTDRIIRLILALGLFSLFFILDGGAKWLGLIGIVPLATAFISWCPIYAIFGASTCKR